MLVPGTPGQAGGVGKPALALHHFLIQIGKRGRGHALGRCPRILQRIVIALGAAVYVLAGIVVRLVPAEDFRLVTAAFARGSRRVEAEETQA